MFRSGIGNSAALIASIMLLGTGTTQAGFINARFETGDLSGWTAYAMDGGTIGTPELVQADVAGVEASTAIRFQVGAASQIIGPPLGGGLTQSLTLNGGTYRFSIDLASQRPIAVDNVDGGRFELVVDGVVRASHDFGYLAANTIERQTLETDLDLVAGDHEFRLQWTREYRGDGQTPYQFLDNVFLSSDPVALGGGGGSGPGGGGSDGQDFDLGGNGFGGDDTTVANPAPGGLVLFGLGFATLAVGRLVRRKRMIA
jgi:hypothetical protein